MKLIVAGSRTAKDRQYVHDTLDAWCEIHGDPDLILSGCATGPDTMAIEWAELRGVEVKRFPADWEKYGKGAGPVRNVEMAKQADALLAFWDSASPGTAHMIATALDLDCQIFLEKAR